MTIIGNQSIELVCELSGNIWSSGAIISTANNGSTEICSVDATGSGTCTALGFTVNGTLSGDVMTVTVFKEFSECTDGAQYFCGPAGVDGVRSSVTLTVIGTAF